MVVSRNDIKRKRKDSDATLETLPDSPKRTKVHAQRKFAQGSNVSSPAITPVKEIEKEKLKCTEIVPPPPVELLPIKRPHTEDFLTFLCFRGTPILPPNLKFFNKVNAVNTQTTASKAEPLKSSNPQPTKSVSEKSSEQPTERPFIAFGVRKRADPFVSNKLEKKRRHALALQALRRKYQEQRMAKIRAVTMQKHSEGVKIKSKNLVQTRSAVKRVVNPPQPIKPKIKVVTKRITLNRPVKRPILKPKMCLRSRGRFIPRELTQAIRKRPMRTIKVKPDKPAEDSSDFSSDDNEPLVKPNPVKVAKKSVPGPKKTILRVTRSNRPPSVNQDAQLSPRPMRKTKEAAAIYMELLGQKLVLDMEADDDNLSIDSFPELPNVRRSQQQENELKAKVTKPISSIENKRMTRNTKQVPEPIKQVPESTKKILPMKTKVVVEKVASVDSGEKKIQIRKVLRSNTEKTHKEKPQIQPKTTEKKIPTTQDKPAVNIPKALVKSTEKAPKDKSQLTNPVPKPQQVNPTPKSKPAVKTPTPQLRSTKDNPKKTITEKLKSESFSDSDEEPLAKLTRLQKSKRTQKPIEEKPIKEKPQPITLKKLEKLEKLDAEETKKSSEVKKVPILPLSDDDEEKAFRGFVKAVSPENKCLHPSTGADLLCKDIGRRFGKGKVNMSTEQIEKWLKDSALAGENKKYEEELIPQTKPPETKEKTPESPNKLTTIDKKPIFQPRRSILLHKNRELQNRSNTKAFSADNESSVYAFEAETESPINTPFRSHVRRPSSTTTSRSEDEIPKPEFRVPSLLRPSKTTNKDVESIAVQVNLDHEAVENCNNISTECSTQTETESEQTVDRFFNVKNSPQKKPPVGTVRPVLKTDFTQVKNLQKKCASSAKVGAGVAISGGPNFPAVGDSTKMLDAPTFYPTEKEFQDPMEYIEKIRLKAERFGVCKIVPPANFKPECKVSDDMRFTAYNQYVHKMLHRWGPNVQELMAIKKYLATQTINLTQPPWIGGMEIDLPRLYQTVQSHGGLKEVIEKKRWGRVAETMRIPKSAQDRVTKLDDIYCKYLLPYDTLSPTERQKLLDEVNVERSNPIAPAWIAEDFDECIVKGRSMPLNAFYRIARNTMSMWFRTPEASPSEVEFEFWKNVTNRNHHICVHSGSIDSSGWGYGFACGKNSPLARHPWNLKVLTNNSGSVLRSMGPVMGVTVPTLHVGMVFSACCWYRDPHGLPWVEYLHTGASKIWYGVPDSHSESLRIALRKLVPAYHLDKTLWLPSDTAMIPPNLLISNGVSLCRIEQNPGQFVVVFPRAFTSSVCTGYAVSESVYFAPPSWLATAPNAFKDMQDSSEPSMFSLERLLISIATDMRSSTQVLNLVLPAIRNLRSREEVARNDLVSLGLTLKERLPLPELTTGSGKRRRRKLLDSDGDYECDICRFNLFVSLVVNAQDDAVYCLEHAVKYLREKMEMLQHCKLLYTYDLTELDALIERIQMNIQIKSQKKVAGKALNTLVF